MNHSKKEVQALYLSRIKNIIDKYGLDSLYFDSLSIVGSLVQLSSWNSISHSNENRHGERNTVGEIYKLKKDLLLAGEICDEETLDLVPAWNYRPGVFNYMFGDYYATFAHTATSGHIPMRYSQTGGISHYSPDAFEVEKEICRSRKNSIPRVLVNYRDYGLDSVHREAIFAALDLKK